MLINLLKLCDYYLFTKLQNFIFLLFLRNLLKLLHFFLFTAYEGIIFLLII